MAITQAQFDGAIQSLRRANPKTDRNTVITNVSQLFKLSGADTRLFEYGLTELHIVNAYGGLQPQGASASDAFITGRETMVEANNFAPGAVTPAPFGPTPDANNKPDPSGPVRPF